MKNPYSESLSHTTWECKYHIVFAQKYRRKEIYGKLRQDIGMILRELCKRKEVASSNSQKLSNKYYLSSCWRKGLIGRNGNPPVILGDNF